MARRYNLETLSETHRRIFAGLDAVEFPRTASPYLRLISHPHYITREGEEWARARRQTCEILAVFPRAAALTLAFSAQAGCVEARDVLQSTYQPFYRPRLG